MQQQLGVDLVLPPEHEPLELLPRRVAELDGHALRHLPLRREHRAEPLLEVDEVPLQPVEPRVDLVQPRALLAVGKDDAVLGQLP